MELNGGFVCQGGKILFLILCAAWLASHTAAQAAEEEEAPTVYWPYLYVEPLCVTEDGRLSGIAIAIQDMLFPRIKGVRNRRIYAPPARCAVLAEGNITLCVTGLLKKSGRAQRYLYSDIPALLLPPVEITALKGRLSAMAQNGAISLEELLQHPDLSLGVNKFFSYGEKVDDLLSRYKDRARIVSAYSPEFSKQVLRMLKAGRIDYTLLGASEAKRAAEELGLVQDFESFTLAEGLSFDPGYIACTRNELGKEVIRRVNALLWNMTQTHSYLELFSPWIPAQSWEAFQHEYKAAMSGRPDEPAAASSP